jgi:hypothetical protein
MIIPAYIEQELINMIGQDSFPSFVQKEFITLVIEKHNQIVRQHRLSLLIKYARLKLSLCLEKRKDAICHGRYW